MLVGYKTVVLAAVLSVLGTLQGLDWVVLVSNAQTAGWVVSFIGVTIAALRAVTTTPIFKA